MCIFQVCMGNDQSLETQARMKEREKFNVVLRISQIKPCFH